MATLAALPIVSEPFVLGTIARFRLGTGASGYLTDEGRRVAARALDAGFLLRPLGDVLYIMPPYAVSPNDLHRLYDFLHDELR